MIQKLRLMKKMTVKELSIKTGINAIKLAKLESGRYNWTVNEAVAIASALSVPVDLFFLKTGLNVSSNTAIQASRILDEIDRLDSELRKLLWP